MTRMNEGYIGVCLISCLLSTLEYTCFKIIYILNKIWLYTCYIQFDHKSTGITAISLGSPSEAFEQGFESNEPHTWGIYGK